MLRQDHTDGNNPTQGAMQYFRIICIRLISQVFIELPYLNDDFQTNYNPMNLGHLRSKNHAID